MAKIFGGSGWGKFKKGKRVSHFGSIRKGTVLLEHSRFKARNVVKITNARPHSWDKKRDIVYGAFVNPRNPKQPRLSNDREFAIWDFGLKHDKYYRIKRR